jgi:uncharacterized protein
LRVPFGLSGREALIAVIAVALQVALVIASLAWFVAARPFDGADASARYDARTLGLQLALVLIAFVPVAMTLVTRRQGPRTIGLRADRPIRVVALCVALSVLTLASSGKISAIGSTTGAEWLRLVAFIGVGFEEELTYRGFLQTRLVAWLGEVGGWVLASGLFAVAHVPQSLLIGELGLADTAVRFVVQLFFGLVFGFIVLRAGSIYAAATLHALLDWVSWL